jgi:hypothetical protein
MTNETDDLISKLRVAVGHRDAPALRPDVSEASEERLRRFEQYVNDELKNLIRDDGADVNWELAVLPFQLDGDAAIRTIAKNLLEPRDVRMGDVGPGCRVVGTPYDQAFTKGRGLSGKLDGKPDVVGVDDGESASGVAIDLVSGTRLDISVTPSGTYEWSVLAGQAAPNARTSGGLGTVTYTGNDPNPSLKRIIQLWDIRGLGQLQGFHGEGAIADASTPGSGPFRVTLAPIAGSLFPGQRLEVWVWAWIISSGAANVLSMLNLTMPSFTVCAGPPVVIH